MERKVLSLKEGNPYEELGLIDAIHTTINAILEKRSKAEEIIRFLVEIDQDKLGTPIQFLYQNIMKTIKESLDGIFTNEMQIPENIDYNNYQVIQKSKYYQLLSEYILEIFCIIYYIIIFFYNFIEPHLRFSPHLDVKFDDLDILK